MATKTDNIIAAVVMLFVPLIYFFGVWSWKQAEFSPIEQEVATGKHLYFVCFSSALYAASSIGFLLAQVGWLKIISSTVTSVCAVILFQEVKYGDKQWTEWSYWLIVIVALNFFLFHIIIEKYKTNVRKNNSHR